MTNPQAPGPGLPAAPAQSAAAKSRLIDYFKRLFAIVAGLAITEAVKRALTFSPADMPWPTLWMFCGFLITIIPIFHGGDRSLDLKYLAADGTPSGGRVGYAWDVYMLVITAILFVCMAETLPRPNGGTFSAPEAGHFYRLTAITLMFDVAVLVVDIFKTSAEKRARLGSYLTWIPVNTLLAAICYVLASSFDGLDSITASTELPIPLIGMVSFGTIAFVIFVLSLLRTIADYWAGRDFLFP